MKVQCRIEELRSKEVVNICDGQRFGYVSDVLLDTACGKIVALVVPGPRRTMGLFLPGDDIVIRWESVKRIGDDLILIECCGDPEHVRRPKHLHF